jgi:predicted ATPase/class 3 adenylate cyclase
MENHPSGTVTFLFTDIEGSTKLAQGYPDKWESLQQRHHAILQSAMEAHNGYVFQIIGDAFCTAFHTVKDGLLAALDAQRQLQLDDWGETPIKVRMGLHTGLAEIHGTDYRGYLTLAKVQRVMSVAYGGQVLISNASAELIHDLPNGIMLRNMKEHRLKGLPDLEQLWQLIAPDLQQNFPPLQSLTEIPNNLPTQLTSFIGREKEVGQIRQRLEKNRLVTLTGSGGVGKTRLSIQVASELLSEYPNGTWLVELAPITDPEWVARAICGVLDITVSGNTPPLTVLTEYLHSKKLLLVVDNCEHLIETCAQLCETLLLACPNLRIIASSREALGIDGESAYRVPSLSLPDPKSGRTAIEGSEAVKLFVERASAVLPEFELTASNVSSVAQICKRLDGIALAIELAASRVKLLRVEQIASRLDDAFRLLTGGSRTALPRQQTIRALIDWSYNLLSEPEKILFRRLAVFVGGWTLEAAESVCSGEGIEPGDVLDLLGHLVDKSLVVVINDGTESRYRRLETIRQYAREKLAECGESELVRYRHMEYSCQQVERIEPGLRGPDQVTLLDSLETELDNLRAALEWALDHDVPAGLRLASRLRWFWYFRNHWVEGVGWLDKFLNAKIEHHSMSSDYKSGTFDRAKALLALTFLAGNLGEVEKALSCATEGMRLCEKLGSKDGISLLAECYLNLGAGALHSGDLNQAKTLAEKSLDLYQRNGDRFGIAEVQVNVLTLIALYSGAIESARTLNESSLAIRQELGDKDGIAYGLHFGGTIATHQGDYERAQKMYVAAIDASHEARSDIVLALALGDLGIIHLLKGEMKQAREYSLQVAKLAQEKWFPSHKALSICVLALYSFEHKQFRKFVQLNSFREGNNLLVLYLHFRPLLQIMLKKNVAVAREDLGEDGFRQAEAEGKAMTLDQALAYALEGIDE